jgi:hypothetical protein
LHGAHPFSGAMTDGWSTTTRVQVADRLGRPDLGRWLSQVDKVLHCSRSVRLSGSSDTIDAATGEGPSE